jgi:hypothetical protein
MSTVAYVRCIRDNTLILSHTSLAFSFLGWRETSGNRICIVTLRSWPKVWMKGRRIMG